MKKIATFILAATMMASMTVTAMAAEPTPRYIPCDYCSNGKIIESYYELWDRDPYDETTYPCVHNGEHPWDIKIYKGKRVEIRCDSCGYRDNYFIHGNQWKYSGYLGFTSID